MSSHIRPQTVRLHVILSLSESVTLQVVNILQAVILPSKQLCYFLTNFISKPSFFHYQATYSVCFNSSLGIKSRFHIAHLSHTGPVWKEIISKNSYYTLSNTKSFDRIMPRRLFISSLNASWNLKQVFVTPSLLFCTYSINYVPQHFLAANIYSFPAKYFNLVFSSLTM